MGKPASLVPLAVNFFPIVRRELMVQARRRTTYRLRLAAASCGLVIVLGFLFSSNLPAKTSGKAMFEALATGLLILASGSCLLCADSFSAERREGTLGLLLLTRVKAVDIVAGKLTSMACATFGALIAVSPVLSLPFLLGGITAAEVLRKGIALASTLLLSISIGLLASTTHDRFLITGRRALGAIAGVSFLPLWLWEFAHIPFRNLGLLSPVVALLSGSDYAYNQAGGARDFWVCILLVHMEVWALLWLAAVLLIRHRNSYEILSSSAKRQRPLSAEAAEAKERRWNKEESHPIEWLVQRQPSIKPAFWAAAVITAFLQPWVLPLLLNLFRPAVGWFFWIQVPSLVLSLISSVLLAWGVTTFLSQGKRTGELELLLTTPAGSQQLISGQWKALKKELRWPVTLMILPLMLPLFGDMMGRGSFRTMHDLIYAATTMAQVGCYVAALCRVGMLSALQKSSQTSAIVWTVCMVKALPQLLVLLFYTLGPQILGISFSTSSARSCVSAILILYYLFLIRGANNRLQAELETPAG